MNTLSFGDFEMSGRAVLAFLHRRLGFDLWMVTRTEGDDWIVLQSEDHGYGVKPGTVFRWADSLCAEMVKGNGPRFAPSSEMVPAYTAAGIAQQLPIKAYVGLPLFCADGTLFGTLCGIHPSAKPDSILGEQELVELLASMLGTILQSEFKILEEARRAEKLKVEALTDALTGLYNRRGWDQLLDSEEDRCRRYGHRAAVLIVDLDGLKQINDSQGHAAGDALIIRTGSVLRHAARSLDIVARLGGDEFGILSIECDRSGGESLFKRIRAALDEANIQACVGIAIRKPSTGLKEAWERADQMMYEEKRFLV